MKFKYPEKFLPLVKSINSAPVQNEAGITVGWSAIVTDQAGRAIGGGTAATRDLATRIAVAESLECLEREIGFTPEEQETLKCGRYPTRCGMAAGFERKPTLMRAQVEAVERWLWSKWVDEQYFITEIPRPPLTGLAEYYAGKFERILYFEKLVHHDIAGVPQPLRFGAILAVHAGGAFPGSRVCSTSEDPWEHAAIEAWRHLKIFENLGDRADLYPFLAGRIKYFGENHSAAIAALGKAHNKNWPRPEIDTLVELRQPQYDGYSFFRAICKDYLPWHQGDHRRFVF